MSVRAHACVLAFVVIWKDIYPHQALYTLLPTILSIFKFFLTAIIIAIIIVTIFIIINTVVAIRRKRIRVMGLPVQYLPSPETTKPGGQSQAKLPG